MTTIHSSGINPLANNNPQAQIPVNQAATPAVTLPSDGFSMGGTQHADQILNSLGLSPIDTSSLMSQLSPGQQQTLSQLGQVTVEPLKKELNTTWQFH